jgi:hypothetical protein
MEQGLMISLNFRHILARSGIGKNDLSGDPGPQGPADPLKAAQSALRADLKRGSSGSFSTVRYQR